MVYIGAFDNECSLDISEVDMRDFALVILGIALGFTFWLFLTSKASEHWLYETTVAGVELHKQFREDRYYECRLWEPTNENQ